MPPAVIDELNREQTPGSIRGWLSHKPEWLHVQGPRQPLSSLREVLGPGEREAIALAAELSADVLLIDDRAARIEAQGLNLPVLGTLRVLADAAEHGLADLAVAFDRLRQTNFRASDELMQGLLARDAKRR